MNSIKKIPGILARKGFSAQFPLRSAKVTQAQYFSLFNTNQRTLFSPNTKMFFSSNKDLENIENKEIKQAEDKEDADAKAAEAADIAESKRLNKYTNKIIIFSLMMIFALAVVSQPDDDEPQKPKKKASAESQKKPEPNQVDFEIPEPQVFKMNESAMKVHDTLQKTSFKTVQEKIDDPFARNFEPYNVGLGSELWKGTVETTSNVINKVAGAIGEMEKVNERKRELREAEFAQKKSSSTQ